MQNILTQPSTQPRPQPRPVYQTQPRPVYQTQPQPVYQPQTQPHPIYHHPHQIHQSQPQPIYQTQPTHIIESQQGSGSTITAEPPTLVPNTATAPRIRITFPRSQAGTCSYALIGSRSEFARNLQPGQMQELDGRTPWKVRYFRNGVPHTYELISGANYVFQRDSSNTLQLYKKPSRVVAEPPMLPQ